LKTSSNAWRGTPAIPATRKTKAVPAVPPTRANDPNGLMAHIAQSLTPAEVKAVAEYFAGLGETEEPFDASQHHRLR